MHTLHTAAEAAKKLNVETHVILRYAREGVIPNGVVIRIGRKVRFHPAKLDAWIDAGGQALPGGWRRESEEPVTAAR